MNADEVVRALRKAQEDYKNDIVSTGRIRIDAMARDCADLIESLQAQLEQKTNEAEGMRSNWYKCIESLKESQRRESAAVEMLIKFIKQSDDPCDYCKNHIECAGEQCEEFEKGVGGTGNDGT